MRTKSKKTETENKLEAEAAVTEATAEVELISETEPEEKLRRVNGAFLRACSKARAHRKKSIRAKA